MKKFSKTTPQGRDVHFRSVFLLFLMAVLACAADPPSSAEAGGEPLSEVAAKPMPTPTAGPLSELSAETTEEPELWVLLSTDDGALPEGDSEQLQAMPPLAAELSGGAALEQVERIRQRLTTQSISLARVNADAFTHNSIHLSLPGGKRLRASKRHFQTLGEKHFMWSGEIPGVAARSTFVVRDGNVTGIFRDENNVTYSMEPVGDGLHALTHVDESLLPPSAKPLQVPRPPMPGNVFLAPSIAASAGNPAEIDLLVVYTPAANRAHADVKGLILSMIAQAHETYEKSGIHIRLNLVDSFEWNYAESTGDVGWRKMIDDFVESPIVNNRRDASGADVAMLIINEPKQPSTYCGMAYLLSNEPSRRAYESTLAFGLVDYRCTDYTFAHELGHIQGAHHNEQQDTNGYFSYGHGFIHPSSTPRLSFRTVMAYRCNAPSPACPRVPYWSSPNVRYEGIATGTAHTNDNVRVLNETAANVAAFRSKKPVCTLSSPIASIPQPGGTYTFEANCTQSPSSYAWTVNGQPQAGGQRLSYTFGENATSSPLSFTISLTATNSAGKSEPVQTTLTQAAAISAASIAVTAPVTGATPNTAVSTCGQNFTCSTVTWTPGDSPFRGSTRYTAQVRLTASQGYTFAAGLSATLNGQAATVSNNNGATATLSYEFAATLAAPIHSAAITLTAPVTGATPNTAVSTCGQNFTCSAVTWTPGDSPFRGSTRYTAQVTLTASQGYTFAAGLSATLNGQAATVSNNNGATATLSYEFAATSAAMADDLAILAQPTKLSYEDGSALDLSGLLVRLSFGDGTTAEVPFDQFAEHNLRTEPVDGTVLHAVSHHGMRVTVRYGGLPLHATTAPLEVKALDTTEPSEEEVPASQETTKPSEAMPLGVLIGGCNSTGRPVEAVAFLAFAAWVFARRKSHRSSKNTSPECPKNATLPPAARVL